MPEESRTLPIPAEHREFTVKVNGTAMPRENQLLAASVVKNINRISYARLAYLDGEASKSDFKLSNDSKLVPGSEIEILAGKSGEEVSLFKGIVIKQSLKIRDHTAPQLVVECKHKAEKMAVGRKSMYYFDQKDSDIFSTLIGNSGLSADTDDTTVTHKQIIQFNSTDWDFMLSRADANGKFIFTNDDTVKVKAPDFSGTAVCSLQFGATILEFDAEMDARHQYSAIKSYAWDAAQQSIVQKDGADPGLTEPGDFSSSDLAGVLGLSEFQLKNIGIVETEAQAWADALNLKTKMAKTSGRAKCEGIGNINPGDKVTLAGVGNRYNGDVYVTGVRQEFDMTHGWKTHVQFGSTEQWFGEEEKISNPKASALLPAMNGLQIGVVVSNEDPDGEFRVRVKMPMINLDDDGIWARIASIDAGKDRGFFFRPEVGDEVVVGFLNDDPRQAIILGMLNSSALPAPLTGSDDNHEKVYQSREKMKMYFNDDKKIMQLETPAGNKFSMDEDQKKITIQDQNGNKLEMSSDGIKIESAKALTLKSGTELKLESGTSLGVKGGTELKLEGSSSAEISSSATTKVKGSLVQIN
jgi:Rhs element Vgr protein